MWANLGQNVLKHTTKSIFHILITILINHLPLNWTYKSAYGDQFIGNIFEFNDGAHQFNNRSSSIKKPLEIPMLKNEASWIWFVRFYVYVLDRHILILDIQFSVYFWSQTFYGFDIFRHKFNDFNIFRHKFNDFNIFRHKFNDFKIHCILFFSWQLEPTSTPSHYR